MSSCPPLNPATLKAPFPYFGGKSRIAPEIWRRFGPVDNYVETFCGSAANLLARPDYGESEVINDACGFVANFWRCVKLKPKELAQHADWPVNENDHHARHAWLLTQIDGLRSRLEGDPDYCDPRIAGYWVCGISSAIGRYGAGDGPWRSVEGKLVRIDKKTAPKGPGISRQIPKAGWNGIHARGPKAESYHGSCDRWATHVEETIQLLSDRLRRVKVMCGDWQRVLTPSFTTGRKKNGITAVFLDPPYASETECDQHLYRMTDGQVSHAVRAWAIEHGNDERWRICLAGYEGEHAMPDDWECFAWSATGGYSNRGTSNRHRERLWFSPHCLEGA